MEPPSSGIRRLQGGTEREREKVGAGGEKEEERDV